MKKEITRVEIDLKKIFLTPPNNRREKITLLVMMVALLFFVSKTGLSSKYLDIFYNANRNWQTKTDKFDILLIGGGKNVEIKKCM